MNKFISLLLILISGCSTVSTSERNYTEYDIKSGWKYSEPSKQGINKVPANNFISKCKKDNIDIHNLTILKNGYIVSEYNNNYKSDQLHDIASVTKIVISLLIGILINQKYIEDLEADITNYLNDLPNLKGVTIKNLLTMTSGLNGEENSALFTLMRTENWNDYLKNLKQINTPGTKFSYNNISYHLLSLLIYEASGLKSDTFAEKYLFEPLGIKEYNWDKDPLGNPFGWGNLKLKSHDLLKIGYLVMNNGSINSKEIVSRDWIKNCIKPHKTTGVNPVFRLDYGYGWFIPKGIYNNFYVTLGRGGQSLYIFPSEQLIIMTLGNYNINSLLLKIPKLAKNLTGNIENIDIWSQIEGKWKFEENNLALKYIYINNRNNKNISIVGELLSLKGVLKITGDNHISKNKSNIGNIESSYYYNKAGNLVVILNEIENINTFVLTFKKKYLTESELSISIYEHQLLPQAHMFNCKRVTN